MTVFTFIIPFLFLNYNLMAFAQTTSEVHGDPCFSCLSMSEILFIIVLPVGAPTALSIYIFKKVRKKHSELK